jgi:hypothetical protein
MGKKGERSHEFLCKVFFGCVRQLKKITIVSFFIGIGENV